MRDQIIIKGPSIAAGTTITKTNLVDKHWIPFRDSTPIFTLLSNPVLQEIKNYQKGTDAQRVPIYPNGCHSNEFLTGGSGFRKGTPENEQAEEDLCPQERRESR